MISLRHLGLVLLVGLSLFGQTCVGQNPLQDLQKRVDENLPRGRFFKKLREDAQAREEKKEEEKRQREQERLEKERERQARELQKRGQVGYGQTGPNQQQYPENPNVGNPGAFRQPPPNAAGQFAPNPQRVTPQHQPTLAAPNTRMPTPEFGAPRLPEPPNTGWPQQSPAGFGIVLVEQKDRLVVAETAPDGNAAQAGLRRGDVITQIGGVDISTLDEFDEITKLMQNGDLIEFQFARNGKTSKVSVSYGSPEQGDDGLPPSQAAESKSARIDDNSNDFAPPRAVSSRNNSILDAASSSSRSPAFAAPRAELNQIDPAELQALKRTVEEQRRTIERLENEVKRLQNKSVPRDEDPPIG